jgi:quinol monooxygenase YgiN
MVVGARATAQRVAGAVKQADHVALQSSMDDAMFCYVWSYRLRPERVDDFRAAYGPEGAWVRLFARDSAYIRTDLLADCADPLRFATIDWWRSRKAYDAFRERFRREFEAIDRDCEELTLEELHIGDFQEPGPANPMR